MNCETCNHKGMCWERCYTCRERKGETKTDRCGQYLGTRYRVTVQGRQDCYSCGGDVTARKLAIIVVEVDKRYFLVAHAVAIITPDFVLFLESFVVWWFTRV
jgi:hypothetical protein